MLEFITQVDSCTWRNRIRERLGAEVVAALNDPAIARRVRDYGAEPWPIGPAQYDAFMRREVESWAPIARASGAMVE